MIQRYRPLGWLRDRLAALLAAPLVWLFSAADLFFAPLQRLLGRSERMGYIFVLPNLLVFGIFILLPMLMNFYYGFTSGDSLLPANRAVVGAANFERLLACENYLEPQSCREDLFWRAVGNTALFVVGEVVLMIFFAMLTALALNRQIRARGFFRSVFFYPVLLSPVVVALIWKWILQYQFGALNALLVSLGVDKIPFLLEPGWARFWVIAVSVWAQVGFYILILLAGLQSIPPSLYEASAIDGSNAVNDFRYITLPLVMPTLLVVLVLSLIRAVQVFDHVFVLTNGGPGSATLFIVQYIYRTGFEHRGYGLAAAASLVLAITLLVLTTAQLRAGRAQGAA